MKNLQRCSANRLNKFLECRFKLALYNFEVEGRQTDDKFLKCGLAVHDWIECVLESKDKALSSEMFFEKYSVPEELRTRFETCCKTFLEKHEKYNFEGEVEAEKVLQIHFDDGNRIDLETRADLIDTSRVGWDWKTGKTVNKPEYILQGQLYCYAFALEKVIFLSLLSGEELVIKAPPEGYIKKILKEYATAVKSGDLPMKPKFDDSCIRWCEYYDICSQLKEELK